MKEVSTALDNFQNGFKRFKPVLKCTILMLFNLANPFWMPIDCNEPLIPNIVCSTMDLKKEERSVKGPPKRECERSELLIQNDCFSFIYSDNVARIEDVKSSCQSNRGRLLTFNCPRELNNLKMRKESGTQLFRKISATVMKPPNIANFVILQANTGQTGSVTFTRVLYDITPRCGRDGNGFFACVSNPTQLTVEGENLIQQHNGEYTSTFFICNEDFMIKYKNYKCHACLNSSSIHSHLYYKDKVGTCQSFLHDVFPNIKEEMYVSKANIIKSYKLIYENDNNDLTVSIPMMDSVISCSVSNAFPCEENSLYCYKFADICVYKLNNLHNIIPCKMGSHLQDCTDFECNLHYKCSGYYCIPWRYVCDGKWDCPLCYDEFQISCGGIRKCQRMFHCHRSAICLHSKDICGAYKDCPYGDDEMLCLLSTQNCPHLYCPISHSK